MRSFVQTNSTTSNQTFQTIQNYRAKTKRILRSKKLIPIENLFETTKEMRKSALKQVCSWKQYGATLSIDQKSGDRIIKEGHFEDLVDYFLLTSIFPENDFRSFLYIYNRFCSFTEAMGIFLDRSQSHKNKMEIQNQTQVKKCKNNSIFMVLESWFKFAPKDFYQNQEYVESEVLHFLKKKIIQIDNLSSLQFITKVKRSFQKKTEPERFENLLNQMSNQYKTGLKVRKFQEEICGENMNSLHKLSVCSLSSIEVARQLTLMDFEMFCSVNFRDFISYFSIGTLDKVILTKKCPSLAHAMERFSQMKRWTAVVILSAGRWISPWRKQKTGSGTRRKTESIFKRSPLSGSGTPKKFVTGKNEGKLNKRKQQRGNSGWSPRQLKKELLKNEKLAKQRSQVIGWFIDVAKELKKLKNFHSFFAIVAGFQLNSINRLDKTWALLPTNYKRSLDSLTTSTSKRNNYRKYRQELKTLLPPAIPCLEIMIYDLLKFHYFDQDRPDKKNLKIINWGKYWKITKYLNRITHLRRQSYCFNKCEKISEIIDNKDPPSEKILYEYSEKLEPISKLKYVHLVIGAQIKFTQFKEIKNNEKVDQSVNGKENENEQPFDVEGHGCWSEELRLPIGKTKYILNDEIAEEKRILQELDDTFDENSCLIEKIITPTKFKNYNKKMIKKSKNKKKYIDFNEEEFVIVGATKEWLIKYICSEKGASSKFVEDFMLTYRSFMEPLELFALIKYRYHIKARENLKGKKLQIFKKKIQKKLKIRVFSILKKWIIKYSNDFYCDPKLEHKVKKFASDIFNNEKNMSGVAKILLDTLKRMESNPTLCKHRNTIATIRIAPKSRYPKNLKKFTFLDLDTLELARQLTLIESYMFHQINYKEYLGQSWIKKDKMDRAPNIYKLSQFFNQISLWLASEILLYKKVKKRTQALKKCINLAIKCKEIKNFNACQEITATLSNPAVHRLKKTWNGLSTKSKDRWKVISDLLSRNCNFQNIRKVLDTVVPPVLPYLGLYLSDLVFIDEANTDYLMSKNGRTKLINFEKHRQTSTILSKVNRFKKIPYVFHPIREIQNWIIDNTSFDYNLNQLFETSLQFEKRKN
ncbi:guanine nucleotide exchange factor [Anaeramoeba flamelloides]|uniref:Guanine nucleotide exchange factor n=1 Tax=Anaeramoeba flamelloides TaxID=1746091 RepID=A0AAV7ZR49_9EUKA|nr:guanine nucleotide exchange factor [Anaeramoeba flamelloides]